MGRTSSQIVRKYRLTPEGNTSLHIVSSSDISVCILNKRSRASDGFLVLPVKTLSTEYIAVSYTTSFCVILIAAVSNDTTVNIHHRIPTGKTCKYFDTIISNGDRRSYSLNRFETISIKCQTDFTGTELASNKPVAVVVRGMNTFEEMLPPTKAFGNIFVLQGLTGDNLTAVYRIVAKDNHTNIYSSTGLNWTIHRSSYIDVPVTDPLCIKSNRAVLVVLCAIFQTIPLFLSTVPPANKFSNRSYTSYHFDLPTPVSYYFMIATNKKYKYILKQVSDNLPFTDVDSCDYSVALFKPTSTNLSINSDRKASVGIIMYGIMRGDNQWSKAEATGFGFHLGMTFGEVFWLLSIVCYLCLYVCVPININDKTSMCIYVDCYFPYMYVYMSMSVCKYISVIICFCTCLYV